MRSLPLAGSYYGENERYLHGHSQVTGAMAVLMQYLRSTTTMRKLSCARWRQTS